METPVPETPAPRQGRAFITRAFVTSWVWLLLPSFFVGIIAAILMHWHVPTQVSVEVVAPRAVLHTAARDHEGLLLGPMPARSISLRGFSHTRLSISSAAAANPKLYDLARGAYGKDAWRGLPPNPYLEMRSAGSLPSNVTIRSENELSFSGRIRIRTDALSLSLSSGYLNVEADGPILSGTVSTPDTAVIDTQYVQAEGLPFPFQAPALRLRVVSEPGSGTANFSGSNSALLLLEVGTDAIQAKESKGFPSAFPVDRVGFVGQDGHSTAIDREGTIRYLGYEKIPAVPLKAADSLSLADLKSFYLREVALIETGTDMRFRLEGWAGQISSGSDGHLQERRLTEFDKLWNNQKLIVVLALFTWVVTTSVALRKYLKDYA